MIAPEYLRFWGGIAAAWFVLNAAFVLAVLRELRGIRRALERP